MLISGLVISLLLSASGYQSRPCNDLAFKRLLKGYALNEYRGRYVNRAYEYSVVIPEGLTGHDGRGEANHAGFGIALGEPPESYIFVRAEHNSLEYDTAREAAMQNIEYLQADGNRVESKALSEWRLGTLNAVRLVVTYTCSESADRYVLSSMVALSPDKSFLYSLELCSRADRYGTDQAVLDRIIESWKMLSISRQQLQK